MDGRCFFVLGGLQAEKQLPAQVPRVYSDSILREVKKAVG